jgi:hypothetical protein
LAILSFTSAFAIPFISTSALGGILGFVVAVCVVVYAALSLGTMFFGIGLPSVFRYVQSAVHRRALAWYQRTASKPEPTDDDA